MTHNYHNKNNQGSKLLNLPEETILRYIPGHGSMAIFFVGPRVMDSSSVVWSSRSCRLLGEGHTGLSSALSWVFDFLQTFLGFFLPPLLRSIAGERGQGREPWKEYVGENGRTMLRLDGKEGEHQLTWGKHHSLLLSPCLFWVLGWLVVWEPLVSICRWTSAARGHLSCDVYMD